ncbi:MAG: aspartate aminotransferase family protein [Polyangiaceae bacterium]
MPTNADLRALAEQHLYPNYRPAPFVLERGKGSEVWDVEGRRYLDLCAGVAVCSVGHAHPAFVKAVSDQVGKLAHVSNWFYNAENIELAAKLCKISGLDRALFCNSGCEANEAMLKLARHHHFVLGDKARTRIIAFDNAFHGRTLGALSMTGTPKYREGFGDLGQVTHVPYGDLEAVKAAMGADVAAIIAEPVQGEGGVTAASKEFLLGLRDIATKSGALFLLDEVQTGVGRMGTWFAYQHYGFMPDALALAKGLGGGFPIGVMLTSEKFAGALPPGTHGSTFGGNPLACAAASAVLRIIEQENLLAESARKGELLAQGLQKIADEFPTVCEGVRGMGLLRGLALHAPHTARDTAAKLFAAGYLIIGAGERVLRYAPPLVVTDAELEEGLVATRAVVAKLAKGATRAA